ncbi:MAG: GNAT family N-acetyltransferase [Candidatus Hodarchaeales archaeon]|jgi:predicted acetyltransferase
MEIRQLTSEDREAFAKLIRYAHDSTRNTYDKVVPEDYEESEPYLKDMSQVYGCFDEDILTSVCASFTSAIIIRNKEFPMSGIWGVATAPQYRNKGFVRQILSQMLKEMSDKGITISCLYAFKFSFYEQLGWKIANENHRYHFEINHFISRPIPDRVVREVYTLDHIKEVYSAIAGKKYNYMVKRTDEDWRRRINPKTPGYCFVCYDANDNPRGYVVEQFMKQDFQSNVSLEKSGNTIYLPEIFWDDRQTKAALFNFLKSHRDHRKYVVFSTADANMLTFIKEANIKANEVFPGSMARIVDVRPVIEAFDYSEETSFVLKVNDSFCEWNNKSFQFTISGNQATLQETTHSPDVTIDIGPLSQMIVGFRTASQLYDSWEIDCSEEMIPMLDQLFPSQNNFYRDFF